MKKNNNVIVINGRRYNALSGELLDHGAPHPASRHEAPARKPAKISQVRHRPSGTPARHVTPHAPKPAKTLMRQSVKKPSDGSKHRIKVQGRLDNSGGRPASRIIVRSSARQPNVHRLQHQATKRSKGHLISHFSPDLFSVDSYTPAVTYGTAAVKRTTAHAPHKPAPAKRPRTTDELLEYAVQHASVPQPQPRTRHRRKLLHRRVHAH